MWTQCTDPSCAATSVPRIDTRRHVAKTRSGDKHTTFRSYRCACGRAFWTKEEVYCAVATTVYLDSKFAPPEGVDALKKVVTQGDSEP